MRTRGRAGRAAATAVALLACLSLQATTSPAQDAPPPRPHPVEVRDGIAAVTLENTIPLLLGNRRLVQVRFPDAGAPAPVLDEAQDGPAARLLRRLYAAGQAAGNHGDLYDNRDRGHSTLPPEDFPQLARIAYGPRLREAKLDYGVALQLLYDVPVIGNSSTALTGGAFWRSQARYALTVRGGPSRLYQNYVTGQIDVYPEHRDHDPERGDLLPANTPYYLISQGSSGSDQVHVQALALILAAFRPDTKAFLRAHRLVAPTVQMVYRRSRAPVLSRAAYLSGLAHPSVFDGKDIRAERMVALANAIAPDAVPPMVQLEVLEEDWTAAATDGAPGERFFDTPSAIARIWRSEAGRREMVVSAAATRDPNGRALGFTWVLLRGDPARTRIEPLDAQGSRARIVVDWQDPRPVPGVPQVTSRRVDIGVFADNGAFLSAPAFVSVLLPPHERRVYEAGPEGGLQIVEINRTPSDDAYLDPAIFPPAP